MRIFVLLLLCASVIATVSSQTIEDHDQVVVCYVASWAVYRPGRGRFTIDDINPMLCTHIVYAFLGMDDRTFTITPLDPDYDITRGGISRTLALRQQNPNLKVTFAVGGWTEGSEKYSRMASSRATRRAFIDSTVEFIRRFSFDGMDLDWEYPAKRGGRPEDRENFILLLKELKEEFEDFDWLLTAAVGAGKSTIDASYDIPRMSMYLDYIHLMGYDYHGRWDKKAGHNAPLYARIDENPTEQMLNVNFSVRYYLSRGAPPEKLVLGLGLYGRTFLLRNSSDFGIGAPARESAFAGPYTREDGFLGFNEICEKILTEKSWSVVWQKAHQAPYMFRDNMWVSFDDVNSLGIKVAFSQRLGLAGVMVWSMDTDDFSGQCGPRFPLLRSINKNLAMHSDSRFRERVPRIEEDDLGRDKPGFRDIYYDEVENQRNLEDLRYYEDRRDNRRSSASSASSSVMFLLSALVAKFFMK